MPHTLLALYHYFNLGNREAAYYIAAILSSGERLERDFLEQYYGDLFHTPCNPDFVGPFEAPENMNEYLFGLGEHLETSRVAILSAEEYNAIVEAVTNKEELQKRLFSSSTILNNPHAPVKRRGLLGKIFH